MIIARVESLILEKGMNDALKAFAYVEAGADGIMIYSRKKILLKYLNLLINLEIEIKARHWLLYLLALIVLKLMNLRIEE